VRELAHEDSRDRRLARHVIGLDDDDAARDAQVVEGRSQRREVVLQALVVQLASVRSVEAELRRKVIVDLRFVLAGQLLLADADETA